MQNHNSLERRSLPELRALARDNGLSGYSRLKKHELVTLLEKHAQPQVVRREDVPEVVGFLNITKDGRGFLRSRDMVESKQDVYVSPAQIKRLGLRNGDFVKGTARDPRKDEKFRSLLQVTVVNGVDPENTVERPRFERLTPVFPDQQYRLETKPHILAPRVIDMLCPIGRGQRGLIVSPPKTGKTTILKQIANGLSENYPGLHVMVVLIGERPEEITDMSRSVQAEVISSSFDAAVEQHASITEMAINRAIRLVELKRDVVILLDSLTRLTRAYNMILPPSGRTLSGGLDPAALYAPKRFFGAARKLENSGSLTIIATCLVDTGSLMDAVIYEEFKDTGNMELHLDRSLAERRIFPAIDISRSSTRREELLLDKETLQKVWTMRRMVEAIRTNQPGVEPFLAVRERLRRTRDNNEFLASLSRED